MIVYVTDLVMSTDLPPRSSSMLHSVDRNS